MAMASVKLERFESKEAALESVMNMAWEKQKELRILVTGKTGQGKSTLINGVLGAEVAKEGAHATRCTTEVEVYAKTINGVPVKVFDSPGLQDRTVNEEEYIQGMRDKCKELSLVLYCTKMINPRLTDDDKHAMKKLTNAFREGFWNYAVFVLTFANMEDCSRKDDRDDDVEEPDYDDEQGWQALTKQRFEGRLKSWEDEFKKFLTQDVGVSQSIVEKIPVVPTGDYNKTIQNSNPAGLPDREDWLCMFWIKCCSQVKDTKMFIEVNKEHITIGPDTDNISETQEHQEIIQSRKMLCLNYEMIEQIIQARKVWMEREQQEKEKKPKPIQKPRVRLRSEEDAGMPPIPIGALLPQRQ